MGTQIDLETLKMMKEMFKPEQHMGQVVPIQAQDRDSFSSFRTGLKDNWIFVGVIFAGGMFVLNAINAGENVDQFQNNQITSNIGSIEQAHADIEQNSINIQTLNNTQVSNYNDVVRRLDSLQASIDAINKIQN